MYLSWLKGKTEDCPIILAQNSPANKKKNCKNNHSTNTSWDGFITGCYFNLSQQAKGNVTQNHSLWLVSSVSSRLSKLDKQWHLFYTWNRQKTFVWTRDLSNKLAGFWTSGAAQHGCHDVVHSNNNAQWEMPWYEHLWWGPFPRVKGNICLSSWDISHGTNISVTPAIVAIGYGETGWILLRWKP